MKDRDREVLIEAAVTAFRERDASGRIGPSSSWCDLSPEDRDAVFALQMESRRLEQAVDPARLSATGRVVLSKVHSLGQLP